MSVRIAVLDLTCVSPEACLTDAFGKAESARLKSIKNPSRRRESEAGFVALSRALGDREACNVVRDASGRPRFEKDIGLDFNISHSASLSVAAVCDGEEKRVGIDIECVREERGDKLSRIAERYFDKKEKELLGAAASPLEFYKIWTHKEAAAKLSGEGLSSMLSGKTSTKDDIFSSHFLIEYSGESYLLCLCTYGHAEIDFICDENIAVEPL